MYNTSLVTQMVKNLPAMQETWVQFLGQKDPLEKRTATHCTILAWRIPWTEEPGGLQSTGSQRVGYDSGTITTFHVQKHTNFFIFKTKNGWDFDW